VAGGGECDDTADSDTTGGGVACPREMLHLDDDELLLSTRGIARLLARTVFRPLALVDPVKVFTRFHSTVDPKVTRGQRST
jgi:hypothetical protein